MINTDSATILDRCRQFWQSTSLGAVLILALTIAAYIPALRAGFIWDDDDHLTQNPAVTTTAGLPRIWSDLAVSRYYPLTLTSFWLQHKVWGLNPRPYHAVNVILHAVNAALLLLLLRRLRVPGAWVAAAIWAWHPTGVESVAWVTELKNVQSALFFLLAVITYRRFAEQPSAGRYALLLLCGAAAMLSKPSTVVLPAVLLLLVWWEHGRWQRSDLIRLAPLIAMGLGMSALAIIEQRTQIAQSGLATTLSLLDRVILAGQAAWFYLGKAFWPGRLMFIYPRWKLDPRSLLQWAPLLAAVAVALLVWSVRQRLWGRACLFGLGYWLLAILPVLGIFDIYFFRYSYVADHFQYLAGIGPAALVTAVGVRLLRWRPLRAIVAAAALLFLWGSTWQYTHVFQLPDTLWQDAATKNPGAWLAHNGWGSALLSQRKPAEAAAEFATALRLKPDFAEAHNNLGNLLAGQGQLAEAADHYTAALRTNPNFAGAHYNLGNVRVLQGQLAAAIDEYTAAVRLRPDFAAARFNLDLARKRRDAPKPTPGN